jgi:selenocysteine-specific elongation factor
MAEPRNLTVGTAGHVDHGKTALVEALTGTRTDRLPEERRRGLSIELGFAELDLGARRLSLVDVPGHERFVRTMIAGAGGVDLYLMVIAADDGVMPQTREHATVLEALGVEAGVVALTKCDLAGPEARAAAAAAARDLLPGVAVVEVSALTGVGIEALQEALAAVAADLDEGAADEAEVEDAVLHIDREFSSHGHGTVVTGTLGAGAVALGSRLQMLPGEAEVRVREVQVHNRPAERAAAVQRVALNLTLAGNRRPRRGDAIVGRHAPVFETYRLDVELLGDLREAAAARYHVHLGTRHATARLVPLGDGFAQLRLEAPLLAAGGDRVAIRRLAPLETVGGARVVDPLPARHGPGVANERLVALSTAPARELLLAALAVRGALPRQAERFAREPALAGALHRFPRRRWQAEIDELLAAGEVRERGDAVVPPPAVEPPPAPAPPPTSHPLEGEVLEQLRQGGFAPPAPSAIADALDREEAQVAAALRALVAAGRAVRVKEKVFFAAEPLERATEIAADLLDREGELTIATLRDALATSRKYAQALAEYLDATRVTFRDGDVHRPRVGAGRR